MYLASDTALLNCQRRNAVRDGLCSDARRDAANQQAVDGRLSLFETIMSPADLAATFGPGLGHDALILQQQTLPARASAILDTMAGSVASAQSETPQQAIDSAPRCFPLNAILSQVNGCAWTLPPPQLVGTDPTPTMPPRAPVVVQTPIGPASFATAPISGFKAGPGLSGLEPSWGDALLMNRPDTSSSPSCMSGWGWLAVALAAGGAVALSRRNGR
jgi:hypothetical protein